MYLLFCCKPACPTVNGFRFTLELGSCQSDLSSLKLKSSFGAIWEGIKAQILNNHSPNGFNME